MPRIPAQLVPQPVDLKYNPGRVIRDKQDMSGVIRAKNFEKNTHMVQNLAQRGENIYVGIEQERDNADLENARRKFMELDSERQEKMLSAQTAADVQNIQGDYDKQAQNLLTGTDQKGVPYFRSDRSRQLFDNKFLASNLKKWNDGAVAGAWKKEQRESQSRKNLSVSQIINKGYDSPTAEEDIKEIISTYPGKTEAERQLMANAYLRQLDGQRVTQHAAGFQVQVEGILKNEDLSPTGMKKQINEQVKIYSDHIDKMKTLTPAEKKAAKDRLGASLTQVDRMVKDDRVQQDKALKKYQTENESDLISQIAKKGGSLEDMPYRDILDHINSQPDRAFTQSFKEKILAGVWEGNKKRADNIAQENEEFEAGVMDAGRQMAIEAGKNSDLKLLDKAMNFSGTHAEWKSLFIEVQGMGNSRLYSEASQLIADKDPTKQKPGETEKSNEALYSKQLDNILFLSLNKTKIDALKDYTAPGDWTDSPRYRKDEFGNEFVDELSENARLELKMKMIRDYKRVFKEFGPDKAEAYIKEEMGKVEKSVDDRELYHTYIDTKIDTPKKSADEKIMYNPQTGEKIILKDGKWQKYGN